LELDAPHHIGPHPLTPPNLVKHVAEASKVELVNKSVAPQASAGALEFSQLAAKYRRAPITELEMEAIEVSYIYIYESNEYMSLILG
jgi:hypothetical protein